MDRGYFILLLLIVVKGRTLEETLVLAIFQQFKKETIMRKTT
jgi:hypothetical protein